MRTRTTPIALLGLALAGCLGACAGSEADRPPASAWFPDADARFVTIERSTTYTVSPADGASLLVVQEPFESPDGRPARLTWIVSVPDGSPMQRPLDLEPGSASPEAEAWVLEEIEGADTHAAPLFGRVTLNQRTAGAMTATLNLTTRPPGGAGQAVTLARRIEFARREAPAVVTPELTSRSGVR